MALSRRLLAAGRRPSPTPPGELEWGPGTHSFVVPAEGDGVYNYDVVKICAVVAGAGVNGSSASPFPGGGAGGLHYLNDIPVTPGETLTLEVPAKGTGGAGAAPARLKRGSTVLMEATSGSITGAGGRGRFDIFGGGGGDGGDAVSGIGDGGLGAGAGGYGGKGGRSGSLSTRAGLLPDTDSGGGRGGNTLTPGNYWTQRQGEGAGLWGRGAAKGYGSMGRTKVAAGGPSEGVGGGVALDGGARIIWGDGRSYPDNAGRVKRATPLYVGRRSSGSASAKLSLPSGYAIGDLCVVVLYSGATLSGGSGNPWTSLSVGNTRVSYRTLASGDMTANIIDINGTSPYTCFVLRTGLASHTLAVMTSFTMGSVTSANMSGFVKSSDAMGYLGVTDVLMSPPAQVVHIGGATWTDGASISLSSYGMEAKYLNDPAGYSDQDLFPLSVPSAFGNPKTAAVLELY